MSAKRGRAATGVKQRVMIIWSWALVPLFVGVGCSTQPVFEAGLGGSDFGTITAPDGAKYQITENADDTVRVEVESPGGNLFFSFGSDGKLTNITLADGTDLDFEQQSNGTVQVTGVGMFMGTQIPINFNVNPANSAKKKGMDAASGDPFIVCIIIDNFCESLEELIAVLLPPLIDAVIDANLPMIIDDLGLTPILFVLDIDPSTLSFPTGNPDLDGPIRAEAMRQVEPKLVELRNFCAHWQLLRLLEISVCDAVGS